MAELNHPLTSLSADEISLSATIIRGCHDAGTKLHFKGITVHEPSKKEIGQYRLNGSAGTYLPPRRSWVNYYLTGTASFFEAIVNLTTKTVERRGEVPAGFHGSADGEEILVVEKVALEDPRTKAEIEKLQLPPGAVVVCDPWIW